MGAWGEGPFENDGALDFLAERASTDQIEHLFRNVIAAPVNSYLDVDDGASVRAACELIAVAFGRGDHGARIVKHASALRVSDTLRLLALDALLRIVDPKKSELAGLWSEGHDGGASFRSSIEDLRARLTAPRRLTPA